MIFRGVGSKLRERDWIAVTIELMLVIAGVFLGIQVSNWNEARKQQTSEAAYHESIADDAMDDVAALDETIRVAEARMALLNRILPAATGRPLPDGFDSARGRVRIEPVPPFAPGANAPGFALFILTPTVDHRSAYETMIATGAIADVADEKALQRIQAYYAEVDRVKHYEADVERNRDKFVDAQLALGLSPVEPMNEAELTAAFAANPELLAAAQNYWLYTNRHLKLVRELQAHARALALSLDPKTSR